tara:strand:+ start:336 stop:524 length:189 start_codon:yes stop_codon:yes gene_type:complete
VRYSYDIVDGRGSVIHGDIPSREQAEEIRSIMREQGIQVEDCEIVERAHYTVTGLGRDPDLH